MKRTYCDLCKNEILDDNRMPDHLDSRMKRGRKVGGTIEMLVNVRIVGESDEEDFCKRCVLDAVRMLDDRPRPAGYTNA